MWTTEIYEEERETPLILYTTEQPHPIASDPDWFVFGDDGAYVVIERFRLRAVMVTDGELDASGVEPFDNATVIGGPEFIDFDDYEKEEDEEKTRFSKEMLADMQHELEVETRKQDSLEIVGAELQRLLNASGRTLNAT